MEYIIIKPKNSKEKWLIQGFLVDETKSEYKVTTDLKEYTSKECNVRFVEDNDSSMLANHQSGVGSQVQQITANSTNDPFDNIPSTDNVSLSTTDRNNTDTVMTDLVPKTEKDAGSAVPFHNVIDNIPLVDNTVSLTTAANKTDTGGISAENGRELNTLVDDDYGTFIPYRDRMIEPKKEVIDEDHGRTVDVNKDANTEEISVGVMPIDDVVIPSIHNQQLIDMGEQEVEDVNNSLAINDTPSAPNRSGRITKRPRNTTNDNDTDSLDVSTLTRRISGSVVKMPKYVMDDEDSDEKNDGSVTTKNDSTPKQRTRKIGDVSSSEGIQCQKCLKRFNTQYRHYSKAKEHALSHTDLARYECPVKGCQYKCGYLQKFQSHFKTHHKGLPFSVNKLDVTTEQEEELEHIIKECFPAFNEPKKQKTCTVCQATITDSRIDEYYMKSHALSHIDIILYKCNQSKCQYGTKYCREMTRHARKVHRIESMSKEDTAIELTDDQKKKIDDIMKKCFPDEEDGSDD